MQATGANLDVQKKWMRKERLVKQNLQGEQLRKRNKADQERAD